MTDPSTNETPVKEDDVVSFSWWLCMLPFIVAIGVFVYKWWQNKADQSFLLYAIAALVIGLVVTAFINNAASGNESDGGTTGGGS
jgi:uncharacterized membrane protein YhaH (DUF805 family)